MPTPNVSIVDLVLQVEKKTFAEEVNEAFREAARGPSKGAHLRPRCTASVAPSHASAYARQVGSRSAQRLRPRALLQFPVSRGWLLSLCAGILAVVDEPLVSVDFRCSDVSTSIDSSLTMVMGAPPAPPMSYC